MSMCSQTPQRPRRTLRSSQNSQLENVPPSDVTSRHQVAARTPVRTRAKRNTPMTSIAASDVKTEESNASDEELARIAEKVEKQEVSESDVSTWIVWLFVMGWLNVNFLIAGEARFDRRLHPRPQIHDGVDVTGEVGKPAQKHFLPHLITRQPSPPCSSPLHRKSLRCGWSSPRHTNVAPARLAWR